MKFTFFKQGERLIDIHADDEEMASVDIQVMLKAVLANRYTIEAHNQGSGSWKIIVKQAGIVHSNYQLVKQT